jgi:2Fe-2S ferredoxin
MITIRLYPSNTPDGPAIELAGKPGQSLMQAAVAANLAGIEADCGGLMTCATCHVYVREPHASHLPLPLQDEDSMLDFTASPRRPNSRLSCQIQLTEALDGLAVDLPASQH